MSSQGTFLCSWQADPFDAVALAKQEDAAKARTNALFCDAVAGMGESGWVVVLDGSQGTTCSNLQQRGVNLSRVLVPNIYTASVAALRERLPSSANASSRLTFSAGANLAMG